MTHDLDLGFCVRFLSGYQASVKLNDAVGTQPYLSRKLQHWFPDIQSKGTCSKFCPEHVKLTGLPLSSSVSHVEYKDGTHTRQRPQPLLSEFLPFLSLSHDSILHNLSGWHDVVKMLTNK